jgi:hypothetical protein
MQEIAMSSALRMLKGLSFVALFFIPWPILGQPTTTLFLEEFDAVSPPDLPAGWTASNGTWRTIATTPSPGSGQNSLYATGSAGTVNAPLLDLRRMRSGRLRYLARRSPAYGQDVLQVSVSVDGGLTFPLVLLPPGDALPLATSTYEPVEVDLPDALRYQNDVVLRFEQREGVGGANLRIDDVRITGQVASFSASHRSLALRAGPGAQDCGEVRILNHEDEARTLLAPTVEGEGFSAEPPGAVMLAAGGHADYSVCFTPAADGVRTGRVLFSDADGEVEEVTLTGRTSDGNLFGFSTSASAALEETAEVHIPLSLVHTGATPLQGVQFSVSWTNDDMHFLGVEAGSALGAEGQWITDARALDGQPNARILLLESSSGGIPAGVYDPAVILRVGTGSISPVDERSTTLTLTNILGSLARPTGDDAGLIPGTETHVLTLQRRKAYFTASPGALDFGVVAAGRSGARQVTVTNPGATKTLAVASVTTTNARYTVAPPVAWIAPGAQQVFSVTFSPTAEAFGLQTGSLVFVHNGEGGGSSALQLTGTGTGGHGDADGDGMVDATDLVLAVDVVLGRHQPTPAQLESIDLFPFPDGDGDVDVRDLTVLAQGIVRDRWPDETPLPVPLSAPDAKTAPEALVTLTHAEGDGGAHFLLDHSVPLRAFQVALDAPGVTGDARVHAELVGAPGIAALAVTDQASGSIRLLIYRPDGGTIDPGSRRVLILPGDVTVTRRYATAVGEDRTRFPVATPTMIPTRSELQDEGPVSGSVRAPYPNPFRPGADVVRIPVTRNVPGEVGLAVYDLTGRRIARLSGHASPGSGEVLWDGCDASGRVVSGGVYLIRLEAGDGRGEAWVVIAVP